MLLGAGLSHFILDDFLLAQMPAYLPYPLLLIYFTGVLELALAAMLLNARSRRLAWLGIALMCLGYMPTHWHIAWNCTVLEVINGSLHIPCWIAWLRLPIQVFFIGWSGWLFWTARK